MPTSGRKPAGAPRHTAEMGALGLLGIRFEAQRGGSGLDTLANAVLAEELGRSTYGGFAITVLVHTDMASPHLYHAGSASRSALDAGHHRRPQDHRGGDDRGRCRLRPGLHAHHGASATARLGAERRQDVHHQRRARRPLSSSPPRPADRAATTQISMFIVEKGTPGFSVARPLEEARLAVAATPPSWCSRIASCRPTNLLGEEDSGFYALVRNLQNERLVLAAQAMGEAIAGRSSSRSTGSRSASAFGATLWDKQAIRQRLAMRCAAGRSGARAALQHRLARRAGPGRGDGSVDAQGAGRHAGQRGACTTACSSTAAWATCARPPSSAWRATPASSRSAAAPPR